MEMYTKRDNNGLKLAYDRIGRAIGHCRAILRSMLGFGSGGDLRIKSEAERQAENRKRCYEAQAMAATWQGTRYNR